MDKPNNKYELGNILYEKHPVYIIEAFEGELKYIAKFQALTIEGLWKKPKPEKQANISSINLQISKINLTQYQNILTQFTRECCYQSKCDSHPNIVSCRDTAVTKQGVYLIMEYCAGGSLKEYITVRDQNGKPLTDSEWEIIIKQVLSALKHVHAQNIIHNDVKPENIFLKNVGDINYILLGDFGNSRQCSANQQIYQPHNILLRQKNMQPNYENFITYYDDLKMLGVFIFEEITKEKFSIDKKNMLLNQLTNFQKVKNILATIFNDAIDEDSTAASIFDKLWPEKNVS